MSAATELSAGAAAALLAVLQGLTEFLPISSSGHLVIAQTWLGRLEFGVAFDVALHLGTLLAVCWAYRADLQRLLLDLVRGRWRMLLWLMLASVPAGLAGVLFEERIEAAFHSLRTAGLGLLCTAVALWVGERRRSADARAGLPGREELLWRDALLVGCAQAVAILPGISRSGSTIAMGMVLGLAAPHAARLSFLMSIIAVAGASVLKLPDVWTAGVEGLDGTTLIGAIALAALVGWASLRMLLLVLARGAFRWFALYCALLGTAVLTYSFLQGA